MDNVNGNSATQPTNNSYSYSSEPTYVPPGSWTPCPPIPTNGFNNALQSDIPSVAFLPKASVIRRLVAGLIDVLVFVGLFFLAIMGVNIYIKTQAQAQLQDWNFLWLLISTALLIFQILIFLYLWIGVACGHTIGNRLTKTRFVNKYGRRPGFVKSFLRFFLQLLSFVPFIFIYHYIAIYTAIYVITNNLYNTLHISLTDLTNLEALFVALIWFAFATLWALFDRNNNKQTIFDKVLSIYLIQF